MRVLRYCVLGVVSGVSLAQPVAAMSTAELAEACRAAQPACDAYLAGALDARSTFLGWHYLIDEIFCGQEQMAPARARELLAAYLAKHPNRREDPASTTVFRALNEAHPCQ